MLKRIDLRGITGDYSGLLPRATVDISAAMAEVTPLLDSIRTNGADPIKEVIQRRDGVALTRFRVPGEALTEAREAQSRSFLDACEVSISRVRTVHEAQLPDDYETQVAIGGTVTARHVAVSRVGLYVPGGLAPLASSVIMNAVPASLAGVDNIAVASPPQRDTGLPDSKILAVCALLGIEEVYAVGGPAAIGMFAYGAQECRPVDMVCGPGNVYVTAAKRAVRGQVAIDTEAGTTEIAILADAYADPAHVAVDLMSQAEHDPNAASVVISPRRELLDAVETQLDARVMAAKHAQRIRSALTGAQSGAVHVEDLEQGVAVVDAYAAEHLEIHTENAAELAMQVRNAGAIFVGPYSPVSLGDYCAGSNHILPTSGYARHSAGLSVHSFLRLINVVEYSQDALRAVAQDVKVFADAEDLPAHGDAVAARWPDER